MFQMIGNTFFSFVEFLNFYLVSISYLRIEKKKKHILKKKTVDHLLGSKAEWIRGRLL
jgi:hypothetical protein